MKLNTAWTLLLANVKVVENLKRNHLKIQSRLTRFAIKQLDREVHAKVSIF
jgi:hypothetical protein